MRLCCPRSGQNPMQSRSPEVRLEAKPASQPIFPSFRDVCPERTGNPGGKGVQRRKDRETGGRQPTHCGRRNRSTACLPVCQHICSVRLVHRVLRPQHKAKPQTSSKKQSREIPRAVICTYTSRVAASETRSRTLRQHQRPTDTRVSNEALILPGAGPGQPASGLSSPAERQDQSVSHRLVHNSSALPP